MPSPRGGDLPVAVFPGRWQHLKSGRPLPKYRGTRGALVLGQGCGEPPMTQSPSLNRREVAQEGRVG